VQTQAFNFIPRDFDVFAGAFFDGLILEELHRDDIAGAVIIVVKDGRRREMLCRLFLGR
jgi:hypothetical protein